MKLFFGLQTRELWMNKMKLQEKRYIYLYGKNYDIEKEKKPDLGAVYDELILHWNLRTESKRVLSSLEGVFISNKPIVDEEQPSRVNPNWKFVFLNRTKVMESIEKKYQGKFFPF